MQCPQCHFPVLPGDRFCGECGAPFYLPPPVALHSHAGTKRTFIALGIVLAVIVALAVLIPIMVGFSAGLWGVGL